MTFSWHCTGCNARADASVTLETLGAYLPECKGRLLAALCLFVARTIHKGCSGDIGVRAR